MDFSHIKTQRTDFMQYGISALKNINLSEN